MSEYSKIKFFLPMPQYELSIITSFEKDYDLLKDVLPVTTINDVYKNKLSKKKKVRDRDSEVHRSVVEGQTKDLDINGLIHLLSWIKNTQGSYNFQFFFALSDKVADPAVYFSFFNFVFTALVFPTSIKNRQMMFLDFNFTLSLSETGSRMILANYFVSDITGMNTRMDPFIPYADIKKVVPYDDYLFTRDAVPWSFPEVEEYYYNMQNLSSFIVLNVEFLLNKFFKFIQKSNIEKENVPQQLEKFYKKCILSSDYYRISPDYLNDSLLKQQQTNLSLEYREDTVRKVQDFYIETILNREFLDFYKYALNLFIHNPHKPGSSLRESVNLSRHLEGYSRLSFNTYGRYNNYIPSSIEFLLTTYNKDPSVLEKIAVTTRDYTYFSDFYTALRFPHLVVSKLKDKGLQFPNLSDIDLKLMSKSNFNNVLYAASDHTSRIRSSYQPFFLIKPVSYTDFNLDSIASKLEKKN